MSNMSISKGLDAIFFADDRDKSYPLSGNRIELPVSVIAPSPYQARKSFDNLYLDELSLSIKENGIIQPLLVRKLDDNKYELLAGECRLRGAKLAGLLKVPVVVCNVDDQTALAFGLIENIQRKDLNPIEEAESFKRLLEEFSLTHDELSSRVGKSRSHISNLLRLNKLQDFIKDNIINGKISMGHARALLSLDPETQLKLSKAIVDRGLSVRQTESLVKNILGSKDNASEVISELAFKRDYVSILSELLSAKCNISKVKNGYKLSLTVDSESKIDNIINILEENIT